MPQWLNSWNKWLSRWLWLVVIAGIIAALPVMYARMETETSSKQVSFALDYRDLLMVSNTQPNPQAFAEEQLTALKQAGVNGMIVFESTLEELAWAGEVLVYNAGQAALLEQRIAEPNDNHTYVLFNRPEHEQVLRPIIEWAFQHQGVEVTSWSLKGMSGLRIGLGYDDSLLRPMQPNPIAMEQLRDAGFQIIPRLSNRIEPYDDAEMGNWMRKFEELGVTRVVFDGDAVTGYGDGSELDDLKSFANQLRSHHIGIAIFENLRVPQKGINKLASYLNFNAIRSHPISEGESLSLKTPLLEDRLVLAVKDRNIRLIYLNSASSRDPVKGKVVHPYESLVTALQGDDEMKGAVAHLKEFGYELGVPQAANVIAAPAENLLRAIAALGALALIALTIGMFLPSLLLLVFVVGGAGAAGLYVLSPTIMIQALALFVSIAAPTAAVILLIRKLRQLRPGPAVGTDLSTTARTISRTNREPVSAGSESISGFRRLGGTLFLFIRTTVLSLAAVPFMVALLNDITYSLVIQQFRGVSLLHMAPIGLVALYIFLYGPGGSVIANAKKILAMPLTVLWIVGIGIIAYVGMYYLSRTGNGGQVSGIEMQFRALMENNFGVRPRIKEFLLGHPIFIVGIFLSLRYRWALILLIPGTIAQLSMVDTFAHIHTPFLLSLIRGVLGLGIGLIIGLIGIAAWQICEWIYGKLRPRFDLK